MLRDLKGYEGIEDKVDSEPEGLGLVCGGVGVEGVNRLRGR